MACSNVVVVVLLERERDRSARRLDMLGLRVVRDPEGGVDAQRARERLLGAHVRGSGTSLRNCCS